MTTETFVTTLSSSLLRLQIPLLVISCLTTRVEAQQGVQLICPQSFTVSIQGNTCETTLQLPVVQATSNCPGGATVATTHPWGQGVGSNLQVPKGSYQVSVTAHDACGASKMCTYQVQVIDKRAPKPALLTTLYANIGSDGTVRVRAAQFNVSSTDNCDASSVLRFAYSASAADTVREYTCAQVGVQQLQVFVFDASGNVAMQPVRLEIMPNAQVCNSGWYPEITVRNPQGLPVPEADVHTKANGTTVTGQTDALGRFAGRFLDNITEWNVSVYKKSDVLNGVNTLDIWHLQRYLTGVDSLTPHQIIAADVNQDDRVTTQDLVLMRKLILGEIQTLPNGNSWRFYPSNTVFPNPKDPFQVPFAEAVQVSAGVRGIVQMAFTGIKLGDIDQSAQSHLLSIPQSRSVQQMQPPIQIKINDSYIKSGNAISIPVYVQPHTSLQGLQFALSVQSQYLEVLEVNGHIVPSGEQVFTYYQDELKTIHTNFTGALLPDHTIHLFTVSAIPKVDGYISDFISLSTNLMQAEAFNKSGTMFNIALDYSHPFIVPVVEENAKPISVIGNSPNPFVEMSILHFTLAQDCNATLRVFDAHGRQVHTQNSYFSKGSQIFLLNREDLGTSGVYHCRIDTEWGSATRKVILF